MKKTIVYVGAFLALILVAGTANAQMMGNGSVVPAASSNEDPAVVAGQNAWNALQSKQTQCSQLTNADYENLGEYFMQQMMDGAHEAMDQAVLARSGQTGLNAMHIAMGKRLSGCNPNATSPAGMMGYSMPMMGWYGYNGYYSGASSTPQQDNNSYFNMMGYGYGYGPMMGYGYANPWGWIFMILFWTLVVVGIVALVRWLGHERHRVWHDHGHSAIDILKERYAKGEIDRKEFEEKKRDLGV